MGAGTVSPLEVAWTLLAAFGVVQSSRLLSEAIHDIAVQEKSGVNGDLRVIALQGRRNMGLRGAVLTFCFGMGVIAMTLPDVPGQYSLPRLGLAALMFALALSLVYANHADRRDNARLLSKPSKKRRGT